MFNTYFSSAAFSDLPLEDGSMLAIAHNVLPRLGAVLRSHSALTVNIAHSLSAATPCMSTALL